VNGITLRGQGLIAKAAFTSPSFPTHHAPLENML